MAYRDAIDSVAHRPSSTPLRERSGSGISTTSFSISSGTEGAPSSCASSDDLWVDLVSQTLEHGEENKYEDKPEETSVMGIQHGGMLTRSDGATILLADERNTVSKEAASCRNRIKKGTRTTRNRTVHMTS